MCEAVYFFFPETSGCHLEEVDAIFLDSKNIFETVSVASMSRRHRGAMHENEPDEEKERMDRVERAMAA